MFQPSVLARRFAAAGFKNATVEGIQGRGKLAPTTGGPGERAAMGEAGALDWAGVMIAPGDA